MGVPACQKSLAEFAARRRQRDFDHFLSGRVPDRKYNSGCKSSAAALCRAQPPKAALGAELCVLSAVSGQDVRAADCNPFVKKGQSPFLTVSYPQYRMSGIGGTYHWRGIFDIYSLTSAMCTSSSCFWSTVLGAPIIRSCAFLFMGKVMTSRMLSSPVSIMIRRSTPGAAPAWGGAP